MRYHLTPVRMAITKNKNKTNQKTENNKGLWEHEEIGTLVQFWWKSKVMQLLWKMYRGSSKNFFKKYLMIQQFHLWVFIQKNWKQDLEEVFALPCLLQHY